MASGEHYKAIPRTHEKSITLADTPYTLPLGYNQVKVDTTGGNVRVNLLDTNYPIDVIKTSSDSYIVTVWVGGVQIGEVAGELSKITIEAAEVTKDEPWYPYDVIVGIAGDEVLAKNRYGKVISGGRGVAGTDDATVIQVALSALTVGRVSKERINLIGDFTIRSQIVLDSYLILDASRAKIISEYSSSTLIAASNKTDIDFFIGEIDANGKNTVFEAYDSDRIYVFGGYVHDILMPLSTSGYGIYFYDSNNIWVDSIHVKNVQKRDAIQFKGCRHVWVTNVLIESATLNGICAHTSNTPLDMFDLHITNPHIVNCAGSGINIYTITGCSILDPHFEGCPNGIRLGDVINDASIHSMIAKPSDTINIQYGINGYYITAGSNINIFGGKVIGTGETVAGDGILLKNSPGSKIVGFSSIGAYRYGINIAGGSDGCELISCSAESCGTSGIFLESDRCNVIGGRSINNVTGGLREYTAHNNNYINRLYTSGNGSYAYLIVGSGTKLIDCNEYVICNRGPSTGTGSEQTIAHGLTAIPVGCKAWITYLVGTRYVTEMIPFDATNVYPTVDNGVAYTWRIE